jgi:hypothetical protein
VKSTRKSVLAGALAGAVIAGGAVGATAFGAGSSTSSTKSNVPVFSNAARSGTFHPIEAKAHEANESAAREAQEDAGQFPTVP